MVKSKYFSFTQPSLRRFLEFSFLIYPLQVVYVVHFEVISDYFGSVSVALAVGQLLLALLSWFFDQRDFGVWLFIPFAFLLIYLSVVWAESHHSLLLTFSSALVASVLFFPIAVFVQFGAWISFYIKTILSGSWDVKW
jgi:ABC-type proline/glycine betaine transport system permease subunit